MTDDPIPDADHVARYCRKASIDDDGRVGPGAFMLRPAIGARPAEDYLSVNWLELLEGADMVERLRMLRQTHPMERKRGEQFAVLSVGNTRNAVHAMSTDQVWLRFLHKPLEGNASHAGIHDTAGETEVDLAHLIAETVLCTAPAHREAA